MRAVPDRGGRVFVDTNQQYFPPRTSVWMTGVQVAVLLLSGALVTALSPGLAALGGLGACGP